MYDPDKYTAKAARSAPSQARGKERVRVILAAALRLFSERGIEDVTTNDIASAANIPIGSLYRYYPNKESIIVALTELYVDDITHTFASIAQHAFLPYLSWDEVLLLMVGAWINYSLLNGSFAFLYVLKSNPRLGNQTHVAWKKFRDGFSSTLRVRCPELSDREATVCFQLSLAAVDMGISPEFAKFGGLPLYHDVVSATARYMLVSCQHHDHAKTAA